MRDMVMAHAISETRRPQSGILGSSQGPGVSTGGSAPVRATDIARTTSNSALPLAFARVFLRQAREDPRLCHIGGCQGIPQGLRRAKEGPRRCAPFGGRVLLWVCKSPRLSGGAIAPVRAMDIAREISASGPPSATA